ncbi:MAG: DUF481 domain-containing protein [Verrucomicrobiota bacterium]
MRIIFVLLLGAGVAFAAETTNKVEVVDSLKATNDVKVAEAVEAMAVTEEDEASEAAEVAEVVQRAAVEAEKKDVDPWEAFAPPADSEFDWLQLTSGEWLKGDFKVLYDFTLEFDSDELDLQEFDFDDVKQLRTRAMKTVFVEGEGGRRDTSVLRGMLEIKDDQILLRRSEHEVSIPRERVISIAGGKQRERDYWSGMASIGINARGGNTETTDATVIANVKRRTAKTRLNADYLASYSEATSGDPAVTEKTADNQRLTGYHDWFWTSRFYWKTVEAEYYRDLFVNIRAQYSVATGFGYDFIRSSRTEWTFNVGAGYQETQFDTVVPPEPSSSDSAFGTGGTRLDFEVTDDIDYLFDYSARFLSEENGEYTHHMVTTLSFDLIGDLDLDISAIWDRIENPETTLADDGVTPVTPEKDDYQLIVSLAYDF